MRKGLLLPIAQIVLLTVTPTPCQDAPHAAQNNREFFSSYSHYRFKKAVRTLRTVKKVTSKTVGLGRAPGEFYTVVQEAMNYGTISDFKELLHDANPVVRAAGLVCLAQTKLGSYTELLESRLNDEEEVSVTLGCIGSRTTVGKIAGWLISDPKYFDRDF